MKKIISLILMMVVSFTAVSQEFTTTQKAIIQKNYITNGGAEKGKIGWATYKTTAQALPTTGSGGSPTSTLTVSTTTPLAGNASFLLTHPASNVQGEGASYDFDIDRADQASIISISGSYTILSGTYSGGTSTTDSDVEVYIYDKTNAQVIQPENYKLDGAVVGGSYKINVKFQTAYNSTSYRLIFHYPNTTATAFVLKYELEKISPVDKVTGSVKTDPTSYTPTLTGLGTVASVSFKYERDGGWLHVYGTLTTGAPSATLASITIPNSWTIDTARVNLANTTASAGQVVGRWDQQSANESGTMVTATGTSTSLVYFGDLYVNATNTVPRNGSSMSATSAVTNIDFRVPILGWGTSQSLSSDAGGRVVGFEVYKNAGSSTAGATIPTWTGYLSSDTHGTFNLSTGQYTIPEPGKYSCHAQVKTTSSTPSVGIYKQGVQLVVGLNNGGTYSSVQVQFDALAGDVISAVIDGSLTFQSANNTTIFGCNKIQGPSQVGWGETISASYWVSASSVACSTTVPINFDSKEFDSHGAVTTSSTAWKFTAPISGIYNVGGFFGTSTNAFRLYKNGVFYEIIGYGLNTTNATVLGNIKLLAGEYIDIRPDTSSTVTGGATLSSGTASHIAITRIGNY